MINEMEITSKPGIIIMKCERVLKRGERIELQKCLSDEIGCKVVVIDPRLKIEAMIEA